MLYLMLCTASPYILYSRRCGSVLFSASAASRPSGFRGGPQCSRDQAVFWQFSWFSYIFFGHFWVISGEFWSFLGEFM